MNLHEYRHLQAERDTLASFLAELPEESVIERMSLEARKEKIEQMIASWTPPSREPARARLTFRGKPVVGTHGIFADFGAVVVKAFVDAVAAIGTSQKTKLGAYGRLPNRGDYQLIITDTALGSFGFELEEVPRTGFFPEVSPVESAIKQTMSILKATVGTDETLTDATADAAPRALKLLGTFLKKLADKEAVCALEFKDDMFRFSNVDQVRQSESRLIRNNIYRIVGVQSINQPDGEEPDSVLRFSDVSQDRQNESRSIQENIDDEGQEIAGHFRGVLPTNRTFEFLDKATGEVISGRIDSAIEDVDVDEINNILNHPANIKVRPGRVGTARRDYVLLAYKDASGQDEK